MRGIEIPSGSLVLLVGCTGSGKSTFALRHFKPTQVISSDTCRGMVSDDPNNQCATDDAFELVDTIARMRLGRRRTTVVDATNLKREDRRELLEIARELGVPAVAIVLNVDEEECWRRTYLRTDRPFGREVTQAHWRLFEESLKEIPGEGFAAVHMLEGDEIDQAEIFFRRPEQPPASEGSADPSAS